ncbi:MED6-domain-containing protein, partial [Linderina pennispora]
DLTGIEWRFTEWIGPNGGLRPDNVLEYFGLSPFWDPSSNNAILRMQTQFNELQNASLDLRQMTGIEFAVTYHEAPALFIITKQRRSNPTKVTPVSIYYVVNGNVYEAPSLYSIISTRMLSSIKH